MKQTPDGPHLQYLLRYGDSGLLTVMVKVAGQPFGPGTALAITGALIIGLAVVTARLMRAAHPPKRSEPGGESQHTRHIRQSQPSPAQKYCRHTETFPRPHRQALSLSRGRPRLRRRDGCLKRLPGVTFELCRSTGTRNVPWHAGMCPFEPRNLNRRFETRCTKAGDSPERGGFIAGLSELETGSNR